MKLNSKVRYGLRAMIEIASQNGKGILQKEIAQKQDIPLKYLDTIITGLKAKGLIINYKGKKSGYILTKPANKISVYDIYCSYEPELCLVDCICAPCTCGKTGNCVSREIWTEVNATLKKTLMKKFLSDIL